MALDLLESSAAAWREQADAMQLADALSYLSVALLHLEGAQRARRACVEALGVAAELGGAEQLAVALEAAAAVIASDNSAVALYLADAARGLRAQHMVPRSQAQEVALQRWLGLARSATPEIGVSTPQEGEAISEAVSAARLALGG